MRHLAQFALVGWGWQQDNKNCSVDPGSSLACQRFEAEAGDRQAAAFSRFLSSNRSNRTTASAVEATFVYRHSQLALDWYALDRAAVYSNTSTRSDWFIVDEHGRRCRELDGGYHWNFSSAALRDYWVQQVIGEVVREGQSAAAGIRAVFLDEGDSTYCGYSFAKKTNCTNLPEFPLHIQAELYRGKLLALREAAELLNAHGMSPIISMHTHWHDPPHCSCALCFDEVVENLNNVSWLKFYEFFG